MSEKNAKEAEQFKEKGNAAFNDNDYETAIAMYSQAVKLAESDSRELATYLKNRAAAFLKKEQFEQAMGDCDRSLEIVPTDPKALFRRAQALERLERFEEAYRDARQVISIDPGNKAVVSVLERLHRVVQERLRQNAQTQSKVEGMNKYAFDMSVDKDKRETAMNNLIVLARENAGAEIIMKFGIVHQIKKVLKIEKNKELFVAAIRIIGELCKHSPERTTLVLRDVGIPWFLEILDSEHEAQVTVSQACMQTILNSFSGMDNKNAKPQLELCEKHKNEIDTLLTCLAYSINNRVISGLARDAIIELITRNVHYTSLNWADRLVEIGGLQRLMEVASELEEYRYESAMNITPSSRTVASVCLARIYENMYYDQARQLYMDKIDEYIRDRLLEPEIESKVRVTVAITSLLRGPLDVGNAVISKEGIMEMVLVMAGTDDVLQQKVASECLIAAASKADKAKAIISQGIDILKALYKNTKDDGIRVRALVGLCKLGSSGGSDASIKPFADGSTTKLAEACRRFLVHPGKDKDLRRWAAEGLSYLTLDAEVKEKLVEDRPALHALIELARTGDQSVLYGVVTTIVNLCNAYDKQEIIPEMVELAKFAKHHIPEEHELDDPDFVTKRILILGTEGVTSALVALSKTESDNSKELISRVFNALCSEQELRGHIVSQGGAKVLLNLSLHGTDKGKRNAAQALARIAITLNPEVAFPGQRMLEVIRPLIALLHPECTALENFESLMALCNIAQTGEPARLRIIKDGGIPKIDNYIYEEHEMLRRAATQTLTNMTMSPEIIKMYEGENDRFKFMMILTGEEDEETAMAAAGCLAILTSSSEVCCRKVLEVGNWLEKLQSLLANPNREMQFRGVCVVKNIIESSKEVAERIIETNVMEILMALTTVEELKGSQVCEVALQALNIAEQYKLIQKPTEPVVPELEPSVEADDE